MEVTLEMNDENRTFTVSVTGVTHSNEDGTDRQTILSRSKPGEIIKLAREYDNEFDSDAVAVFNAKLEQLGYLPKGDRLARHLDSGGKVEAKIKSIIGGPSFFEKLLKKPGKSYGCVLLITKGDYDWAVVNPLREESQEIEKLLAKAKKLEAGKPEQAIKIYIDAIDKIMAMDSKSIMAASWRRARHPINRLSLLLEQQKQFEAAYQAIIEYESFNDKFGLVKTDQDSIVKRKERLHKKLAQGS